MYIKAENAELHLFPHFIKSEQASLLFEYLTMNISWQQDQIRIHQKVIDVPRLHAWYQDNAQVYEYSGIKLTVQPWLKVLNKIKSQLNEQCEHVLNESVFFNAMLANLYRDNNDSVAWHSDDEPELGETPIIASVSLGAKRDFKMKHKITGETRTIPLTHGSLLLMAGETQNYWQHAILKSKKVIAPRINLTFRHLL